MKLLDDDEIFWSGENKRFMKVIWAIGGVMVLYFGAHLLAYLLR